MQRRKRLAMNGKRKIGARKVGRDEGRMQDAVPLRK